MSSEKEYQVNSISPLKASQTLGEFKSICDEIAEGYENGSRVRFVEDATSADGYRRLSKEDELSILSSEFEEFVEKRFGKQHQEESVKAAGEYMSLSR